MFKKKIAITSAVMAGLVSGIALADDAAPAADHAGAKMEKKNECKGMKNECKGKKEHHKNHKKKDHKNACAGPNGCGGKETSKDTAEKPAAKSEEKKSE